MLDVEPGRILRVMEAFATQPAGRCEMRLCSAAAKLLDVAGVGMSLGATDDLLDSGLQTVGATDGARDGEALQLDLGEGPSYTAYRTGWPVQVPDLERDHTWPAFARAAATFGLRGVFAFPLPSSSGRLGTVTLYRHAVGELSCEQYADALAVARVTLDLLTSQQVGRAADHGPGFTHGKARTESISQASGIVSVQLGIPIAAALALLRAHAFVETSSLAEVATQVVEHRLKLAPLAT